MDGSSFGPSRLEFQAGTGAEGVRTAPEPSGEPGPEREWGLSAWQVVVVVLGIVAACELIGRFS